MRERYGRLWPDEASDLDIELVCFRQGLNEQMGGLGKYEHLKRIITCLWPLHTSKGKTKSGFEFHPWAEQMLQAACENQYMAVSGPKSSGKSQTMAVWALVNWLASPSETLVLVTSTSLKEARMRIWGAIRELYLAVPGLPGKLVDSLGILRLDEGESSDRSAIVLIPSSPEKEKEASSKLIGLKQKRVYLIVDEMTDISSSVVEALYNLDSNPEFQFVGLGNFKSMYDPFGQFCQPKAGWSSVTVEDGEWKTKLGLCLHLDGMKSPNLTSDDRWPYLLTTKKINEAKAYEGENSLQFWRFIRSFPAPAGVDDCVFSEADIRKFNAENKPSLTDVVRVMGIDPSFSRGGDRTIACIGKLGKNIATGVPTFVYEDFVHLVEDVRSPDPRHFQLARQVFELCRKYNVLPRNIGVDATGGGAPFCDILAEILGSNQIMRVQFGNKPTDLPVSAVNPIPAKDKFDLRATELWYVALEALRSFQLGGVTPQLATEMTNRKYQTIAGGKIRLEPKVDYKSRVGKSPDLADAAFICLDVARHVHGFYPSGTFLQTQRDSWRQVVKRKDPGAVDSSNILLASSDVDNLSIFHQTL